MKRAVVLLFLLIVPVLALADSSSLTFAPPPGDYSMIFLGNLFGNVDGVLTGTGSQILGAMFSVFNSAVLALGGMIIMYTLMVSTMNTAHEGQMLGQKWSSIWIPVRSTLGLALLIPKASGYCLMQIFVMWVVVQGVGAADKIWDAALSYLNRGGVIIKAQGTVNPLENPTDELTGKRKSSEELEGAKAILTGQVCMLGLQKQLEAQRQSYLDEANKSKTGGCNKPELKSFCQSAVPDFIASVNAVALQSNNKDAENFSLPMPNFDKNSPYYFLKGICGTITWNNLYLLQYDMAKPKTESPINSGKLTSSELETTRMSRAIAIQGMYLDLANVARIMVNNDPQIGTPREAKPNDVPTWAIQLFGVPYTKNGEPCPNYEWNCTGWGSASLPNGKSGAILRGDSLQLSVLNYRNIMAPVLKMRQDTANNKLDTQSKQFISDASSKGWILAGSYFFDLVKLNGNAMANANLMDENTGLTNSKTNPLEDLKAPFNPQGGCKEPKQDLCQWFGKDPTKIDQVNALIYGVPALKPTDVKPDPKRALIDGASSSTVMGYINNALMVQLPGQPGLKALEFPKFMSFTVDTTPLRLEWIDFECGGITIIFFKFCLGYILGNVFYNIMFLTLYNALILVFAQLIKQVVLIVLMIPLQGMSEIFKKGIVVLAEPGVNPIVALANMGTMYINFAGNLWIMMLTMAAMPLIGVIIFPLIMLAMPLILSWLAVMVAIGFITAYYIPIMPYMIFTFAAIGWLICVIEAMVAAPLVALGVTHPEGHDAFGKGEQAIMILMNVFLRPAMMIIGFVMAISLSYVGVWVLNAGYDHAISFMQGGELQTANKNPMRIDKPETWKEGKNWGALYVDSATNPAERAKQGWEAAGKAGNESRLGQLAGAITGFFGPAQEQGSGSGETKFNEWAGIYAFFFSILTYTMMYLIIVQKAFSLITHLPDKVLRWIGGQAETAGQEAAQWGEEAKRKTEASEEKVTGAQQQMTKKMGAGAQSQLAKLQGAEGNVSATPTKK